MKRICKKCGIEKEIEEYRRWTKVCKECCTLLQKQYREENKDKYVAQRKAYDKKYRSENKDKIKKYEEDNREKTALRKRKYRRKIKESLTSIREIEKMDDRKSRLVERRMIELDPSLAAHYLTFNTYANQRNVRPVHVDILANKMKEGLFRFGEVAFISVDDGRDFIANGQHVCSAVVQSGVTVPCMLEKFKTKTHVEASEIFRQFEILPRSLGDMLVVEARALELDWPKWVVSLVTGAAVYDIYFNKTRSVSSPGNISSSKRKLSSIVTKENKVEMLSDYKDEGCFVNEILTGAIGKKASEHISKVHVVLVMINTWRVDASAAKYFWKAVRDGEYLERDNPEMLLRNFLLLLQTDRMLGRRKVTQKEIVGKCVNSWNAYRRGGRSKKLYYSPNKPIPKLA